MVCEETCGFSTASMLTGDLPGCELPRRRGYQKEPSERTLCASLWHCSACERDVRVYSRLAEVISGLTRNDCPTCGGHMAAGSAAEPYTQVDFGTRTALDWLKPTSAWAA